MKDAIIVGGGLGGAALACKLARAGLGVAVFEQEERYRDRVRGEGLLPWGVNEARELGIDGILERCGRPVDIWTSHAFSKRSPRNLRETTPRGDPCLDFYHPAMQEAMIAAAADAGAEVHRGVTVKGAAPGKPPKVRVSSNGREETLEARLVVGADGRDSRVRRWAGFEPWIAPPRLRVAGVLLEGGAFPDESVHVFRNSSDGRGALFFPLGGGRTRAYAIRHQSQSPHPISGRRGVPAFRETCLRTGVPAEWLDGAEPAGPLADFDGADRWVKRPYRDGIALVGDAASSNDPSWGNGLALTLRDVRALSDCLLADEDWERAAQDYATRHDEHFGVVHRVTTWLSELLYEVGPEAEARRERAFSAMQDGQSRNPDIIALGPEAPSDEQARRRMLGED